MVLKRKKSFDLKNILLLLSVVLFLGCNQAKQSAMQDAKDDASVFIYDEAAYPGENPWSSLNFKNNPDNFQFAVLGDRGGGASPLGTCKKAIDQLNMMKPEFAMSVGDFVEGYTNVQEEWMRSGMSLRIS